MKAVIIMMAVIALTTFLLAQESNIDPERTGERIIRRANRQHQISEDYYLKYSWSERPKIGTPILIIKLFDSSGSQTSNLDITSVTSMPGMACCAPEGEVELRQNRNGDYLVPVNFTMTGEWEIKLTFWEDDNIVELAYILQKI